jgi:hypothetical protein
LLTLQDSGLRHGETLGLPTITSTTPTTDTFSLAQPDEFFRLPYPQMNFGLCFQRGASAANSPVNWLRQAAAQRNMRAFRRNDRLSSRTADARRAGAEIA